MAGDAERACETLSSGRERARALGLVLIRILSTAWLGYAEREAGRLGEARAHAEEALRDSRACRFAWAEVLSLRYLACALADSNEGDPGQPEALWRDAIAIATRCGATPYGAKARLELGEYLSSTGRTDEARALIESASAEFSRMGMRRWLERAAVTGQTFK